MKKVVVLTPVDARHGFALSGVRQFAIARDDLGQTLLQLARDADTGVVIVDERLVTATTQEELRRMERRWPGVLIVLPAPEKAARIEEDYVLRLIRRAIGYQVRLSP